MFMAKVYGLLWLFVAVAAAGVFSLTGSFSPAMTMVFGFIVSVLAGAGLLVVFPAVMSEHVSSA